MKKESNFLALLVSLFGLFGLMLCLIFAYEVKITATKMPKRGKHYGFTSQQD